MTQCHFNTASSEALHSIMETTPNNDIYVNCATVKSPPNLVRSFSVGGYREKYTHSHTYEPLFDSRFQLEESDSYETPDHLPETIPYLSQQINELKSTVESLQKEIAILKKHKQNNEYVLKEKEDLMVTVSEFSQRKSAHASFISQPFTAYHSGGYKLKLQVYPGGDRDGRGSHLSVFVRLVSGPCHNKLRWPFVGTVTIKLLNQITDKNHFSKQISFNESDGKFPGSEMGVAKFISHKELSSQGPVKYLVNDTVHFLVGVVHHQRGSATLV